MGSQNSRQSTLRDMHPSLVLKLGLLFEKIKNQLIFGCDFTEFNLLKIDSKGRFVGRSLEVVRERTHRFEIGYCVVHVYS
jgi:hypothetical protein